MKSIQTALHVTLIATTIIFTSCTGDSTQNPSETTVTVYECPMKCEGDKTYTEAGTCPVCGMELTEAKE